MWGLTLLKRVRLPARHEIQFNGVDGLRTYINFMHSAFS
jgi:hypothetical protein